MGTKDTRSAHGAVGKTDMLLFDPESMGVINDPSHPLYDARANEEPTEAFIENLMVHGSCFARTARRVDPSSKTVARGR